METRDWTDREFDPSKGPILVKVSTVERLFNSLDPQPLDVRDLDVEIADWIGEWADEQRRDAPITIEVLVADNSAAGLEPMVVSGIHNHFAYRRWASARQLSRLWRDGRISLVIGLTTLVTLTTASRLLVTSGDGASLTLREGLAVAGWVAMWHPMQIFLYDWWPLRRELRTYQRLAEATIIFSDPSPTR